MSKKFYQSQVLNNLPKFISNGVMRGVTDMYLIHKICEYFQPKSFLEIGFFAGQGFGTCVEACSPDTQFTSVDLKYKYKYVFDSVFKDQTNMTFIEQDSKKVILPADHYDMIVVDGDHSYEYADNDIKIALNSIKQDGILCVDDFANEGVWQAILENLTGQHDWIPFLMGQQQMFFHHTSHSADEFLDTWLPQGRGDLITVNNFSINMGPNAYLISNCYVRYTNVPELIENLRINNI